MNSSDIGIAKFVFNTKRLDELQLSMIDLKPGDSKEYNFSVTNNYLGKTSSVVIAYQMIVKTYHLVPLDIQLYRVIGDDESLILTCDESFSRNEDNELVCNSPTEELGYGQEQSNDYKLKVKFPEEYNQDINADLVDFINIEIKSWQKAKD
jgi:hypothetical protein